MAFAADFRFNIIPRLNHLTRVHGLFVACGLDGFDEAWQEIYAEARRCGANHLSDAVQDDLREWITTTLLTQTVAAERRHGLTW